MKAIILNSYGSPDVLRPEDVPQPVPGAGEVLVKVHAAGINASDGEFLTGSPAYIRMMGPFRPRMRILGSDIAGTVAAAGSGVTSFKTGDAVFGDVFERWGGLAEYVSVPATMMTLKPDSLSFEQAASLPQTALLALQGIRDKGRVKAGQKVLINGAGGGAGTIALQLAKLYGAEVTGVDNAEKREIMLTLGADHAIDYTQEDFTRNGSRYDLILDLVAGHSIFDYRRALARGGRYLMVGGKLRHVFGTLVLGSLMSLFGPVRMGILGAEPNRGMDDMLGLIADGSVKPVIDRTYPLAETADAFRRLLGGHAPGRIVINVLEET